MSSTKRKAPTAPKDGSEHSRAQRKRVQNRISQKCHRERQAAHARHLESVVEVIKAGDQEGDDASNRYTALLRQHMKIIEEKHELEEALFRMRKKLLSISNSAAAAAEDEAVDALARPKNRTRQQSSPDSPLPSPPPNQSECSIEKIAANFEPQRQNELAALQNVAVGQPSANVSSEEPQPLHLADSPDMSTPSRGLVLPPISWTSPSEQPHAPVCTAAGQPTPQDSSWGWHFGTLELSFPLDYPFSTLPPTKTITLTSPSVFSETILHACRKCVGLRTSELDDPQFFDGIATLDWSKTAQDVNGIAKISEIGVQMLAVFAGLEPYIYGVGAASIMESLMRWRLMPTFASRTAIPEPFRPTPLQYSTINYPVTIDFINWPSIRDQLILQSRTINVDEIIREVVKNTVVEIPHRHVSVNVLSLFYSSVLDPSNHKAGNNNLKTAITDSQWSYLELPGSPDQDCISLNEDPTPAESALVQEISRRMETGSVASSPEGNNQLSTIDTISSTHSNALSATANNLTGSWSTAMQGRNEIVTRFGLDQLTKWKLSKEFACKHPFLDCSSAVSAYDMVSAQSVLEAQVTAY